MPYTLVVCEKPDAARRIAHALGAAKETRVKGVPFLDVEFAGKQYRVCSASGHLYGLVDETKNRSVYPVFDLEWAPKEKGRASRIIDVISDLSRDADSFVHGCDYDQEGEVIGYNILQYACGKKYAGSKRIKLSTLTDDEIRQSFAGLTKPSSGLAQAGRARHMIDFLYGVNLSRAISQSFKSGGRGYRNLSIGRVQGPTLAFAAERELEIGLHIPDPYWVIEADFEKDGRVIHAKYEKPKIESLAEARLITQGCSGKDGRVQGIRVRKTVLRPPTPFNIGDLQQEVYRLFKLSPSYTLSIAEKLYLRALISYPRTSSQKLPASINYQKILSGLSGLGQYRALASSLLSKQNLVPNEGRMTDPAHPAIYPTGVQPGRLSGLEFKIYDLVVRRFLATFGEPAVAQITEVDIDVGGYKFLAAGRTSLYDGWMAFYRPYVNLEQTELPALEQGDVLASRQITMEEKFTVPPARYNQASLLARMEVEQIGTKATRADVIATLFKRNYLASKKGGIEVTGLGLALVELMKQQVPDIVSTSLTRSMEDQLEQVEQGSQNAAFAILFAASKLTESLVSFRQGSITIGRQLAVAATQSDTVVFGSCPICKNGRLQQVKSRTTGKRFVGCSNYSAGCKASAPLPQKGSIKALAKTCKCGWPKISVAFGRGRRWNTCINASCPYKSLTFRS